MTTSTPMIPALSAAARIAATPAASASMKVKIPPSPVGCHDHGDHDTDNDAEKKAVAHHDPFRPRMNHFRARSGCLRRVVPMSPDCRDPMSLGE